MTRSVTQMEFIRVGVTLERKCKPENMGCLGTQSFSLVMTLS